MNRPAGDRDSLPNIGRLIVLAAPSAAGKTTMLRKVASGGFRELSDRLDLGDFESWRIVNAIDLPGIADASVPKMILHYALPLFPLATGMIWSIATDRPMAVLERADEISFVTLYTNPASLLARVSGKTSARKYIRISGLRTVISSLAGSPALRKRSDFLRSAHRWNELERLVGDPEEIKKIYDEWFSFAQGHDANEHLLVCTDGEYALRSLDEWDSIVAGW